MVTGQPLVVLSPSYTQGHFISKFNKNETKFGHRLTSYSCSILKFNITTTENYELCRKIMYTQKNNWLN